MKCIISLTSNWLFFPNPASFWLQRQVVISPRVPTLGWGHRVVPAWLLGDRRWSPRPQPQAPDCSESPGPAKPDIKQLHQPLVRTQKVLSKAGFLPIPVMLFVCRYHTLSHRKPPLISTRP